MAVNPDDVDAIAAATAAVYKEAEAALLATIRGHLARGLDRPSWAEERLAAVGALRRSAEAIVRHLAASNARGIREAVAAGYRTGRGSALADLPKGFAPDVARAARRAIAVAPRADAMESLAAALVRDVGERQHNVLRHVEDVYRQTIAGAVARSIAGNLTRREASQAAFQRFVDEGVASFVDARGRTWRLSTYVEMAVRTVTARAAIQGQVDRLADMGMSYVVVSDEAQECIRCRPFEGKVLRHDAGPIGQVEVRNRVTGKPMTITVLTTLDGARLLGFQHPNCRHTVRAYIPGATRLPTKPTADPQGDKARQRQREIERHLRRWKEREAGALDGVAAAQARAKVRAWQGAMRAHLAAHPALKRLSYREQPGAGNTPSARVDPATPLRGGRIQAEDLGLTTEPTPQARPAGRRLTPDQAADMQVQMLADAPWTPAQREALQEYTGGWAQEMNGLLRDGTNGDATTRGFVKAAFAAMRPLPEPVELFRFTAADAFGASVEALPDLVGQTMQDLGFMSTTIAASGWASEQMQIAAMRPVLIQISAPAGTPAAYVDDISAHQGQWEVILAPGTKYLIVSVTDDGTHIVVAVEVVP